MAEELVLYAKQKESKKSVSRTIIVKDEVKRCI